MGISELQKLLNNLKKAPNRTYSLAYIKAQEDLIQQTRIHIFKATPVSLLDEQVAILEQLVGQIPTFLKPIISETDTSDNFDTMASFDLVTASKLIQEFTGSHKELSNFLGVTKKKR